MKYKNPNHNRFDVNTGPEFYETSAEPVSYKGYQIVQRVTGRVWDVVQDNTCLAHLCQEQYAKLQIDILNKTGA